MKTRRITTGLAMAGAAVAMLSGCVTLSTADSSAEKPETTTKPAATDSPSDGDSSIPAEAAASDGGGEETTSATSEEPIDTGGKPTYLNAIQAFSPQLETWQIDGKSITYTKRNCLAQTKVEATGTLGEEKDNGATPVVWDSTRKDKDDDTEEEKGNPFESDGGQYSGMTTQLEVTDESIGVKDMPEFDQATAEIDEEKATFDGMCIDAGESVGSFVFS